MLQAVLKAEANAFCGRLGFQCKDFLTLLGELIGVSPRAPRAVQTLTCGYYFLAVRRPVPSRPVPSRLVGGKEVGAAP